MSMYMKPPHRRLRGFAFDPSLSLKMDTVDINQVTYKVPWEDLCESDAEKDKKKKDPTYETQNIGPIGEYVEVVDFDPTVKKFYKAVDLNNPYVLAQDGLDPSESNPQFHQQMVYAVAMTTIKNFESALGRKVLWSSRLVDAAHYEEYVQRLRIYPHALRDANAFYSPQKKALLFGYFTSTPANETLHMPGSLVFTCLSHDIIAHECTHAILDGMHRYYNEPTNPDVLAFHEAFADIVALFQHFTFPEVLKHQIARTRGDLASQNLLGQLAQEFGSAIGSYGSLRDAIGSVDEKTGEWKPIKPNVNDYKNILEPHARGSILVAAVFEAFISIYKSRVADLLRIASNGTGILPQGDLHPDLVNRLATEASKAAGHVLKMCIRALDYCPPVDITFGDYLRAIITADLDVVSDDSRDYRLSFIDAFRRRGIYPQGIKTLSVESLRHPFVNLQPVTTEITEEGKMKKGWTGGPPDLLSIIASFLRHYGDRIKYVNNRQEVWNLTRDYLGGKYSGPNGEKIPDEEKIIGLHRRLEVKFARSTDFEKITGLAFSGSFTGLGIRQSRRYNGPSFQVQNLRLVSAAGPTGKQLNHVIFSITQRCGVVLKNGKVTGSYIIDADVPAPEGGMELSGGCTLIFDLDTLKLKYAIAKPLINPDTVMGSREVDKARAERQYNYLNNEGLLALSEHGMYFGQGLNNLFGEPFSLLHTH
jgi:hypothetical protein